MSTVMFKVKVGEKMLEMEGKWRYLGLCACACVPVCMPVSASILFLLVLTIFSIGR